MSLELWLPITGYDDFYEVSSHGRIRSHDRMVVRPNGSSYILPGRIMKTRPDINGYVIVDLTADGVKRTFKVHRLVATAFIPNPDALSDVDHEDGVRDNNWLSNLRWMSHGKNLLLRINVKQASGYRGIRLQRRALGDRYQAYCYNHVQKKFVHIGVFDSAVDASAARVKFITGNPNVSAR